MSFGAGARRGPYEIQRPLGAGGMGEVYCARDTRLGRDVAIKVLPAALAPDPDRLARFRREAQLLAALNHPNIAAIYGLEESDDALHLVMELVEGPTLAERIAQGPIPLAEALVIARQIAEGLEYAHERGIIHRDLKPANIKVTPDDKVKILDFGLAKAVEDTPGESASVANSPTLSMAATKVGVILGTAAYMAPEQARGKAADRRADIWAFGVVLFELLVGRQLYTGEMASDVLASVIKDNIPWDALPKETPPPIQKLLRRCLEKDPQRRLRDIGEARIAIDEYTTDPTGPSAASVPAAPSPHRRMWVPWACTALAVLVALVTAAPWRQARRPALAPLVRLNVNLGADASLGPSLGATAILSPDGTRLVNLTVESDGRTRLATRLLEQAQPVTLAGTESARSPFFAPDGQWIGFFADEKLKKVSVLGGGVVTVCNAVDNRGGHWGADGNIVLGFGSGSLASVPAAGGTPAELVPLAKSEHTQRWPQILPGGAAVLFTSAASRGSFDDSTIDVVVLKTGERRTLQRAATYGRFVPSGPDGASGHLLFVRQSTLYAAPMDLKRLEVLAPAVPMLESVAGSSSSGGAQFAFSETGMFLYLSGSQSRGWTISWLHASGRAQPLRSAPGMYFQPRISPDGDRLAVSARESGNLDVWIYSMARDTMTRLTFGPGPDGFPVWSPDGKHIAFSSDAAGVPNLFWTRADGGGEIQRLTDSPNRQLACSFSPDGKHLAFTENGRETGADIWTLPVEAAGAGQVKAGKPALFLGTKLSEFSPAFSPDGRWMAYASNESGEVEVFVRPFPGPGGKWQVSSGNGIFPVWSRAAPELFYRTMDGRIMKVRYKAVQDSFVAEKPVQWVDKAILDMGANINLDLAPDGKRFATTLQESDERKSAGQVTLLLNFFDELHRRVPAGRK